MSNLVNISDVKPGMVIIRITEQNGPVKIRKSGLVSSEAMVQGLAEMGVQEVEVDPAQTVEIEKPVHHRTQTQALLRGEHDTSVNRLDSSLSEQFNRSLFLPTVQGLPSLWKVYTRQVLSFGGMIIAGLILGGAAGSYPAWWPEMVAATETNEPASSAEIETPKPLQDVSVTATGDTAGALTNAGSDISQASAENNAQNQPAATQLKAKTSEPNRAIDDDKPEQAVAVQPVKQPTVEAPEPEDLGGEVINAPQESDVDVSPELMARFNKAIEDLDNKATEDEPDVQIKVRDDLPRVDQLPVRMLTRLPSMAFNAHMYASRPSDRWVRVNGKQLGEGDWIDDKVQIVNIEAQRVILRFENKEFSMAALTDW